MFRDYSIENHFDWRYFGKRYLYSREFISLCDLVGLHSCSEHELESYEESRVMFPVARMIMPEDYARAFWVSQFQEDLNFEFEEKYVPIHNLDWQLRYQIPDQNTQDFRHPIDKSWGMDGLEKPFDKGFLPWDSYTINIQLENRPIRESTVSHFYHYWQIYELYNVRKFHGGMYKDNSFLNRFRNVMLGCLPMGNTFCSK